MNKVVFRFESIFSLNMLQFFSSQTLRVALETQADDLTCIRTKLDWSMSSDLHIITFLIDESRGSTDKLGGRIKAV
jgi:hypothetical protein